MNDFDGYGRRLRRTSGGVESLAAGARLLMVCGVLLSLGVFAVAPAHATKLPLVTFYHAGLSDHFTTSNPAWTCQYFGTCARNGSGYEPVALQGHVYSPSEPQPAGTVALYNWFSPVRNDNFLTSAWAGAVGAFRSEGGANYTLFRIEGYISTTNSPMPLTTYWNGAASDNATVATWRTGPRAGYGEIRIDGFLLPPDSSSLARCQANQPVSFQDPAAWQARGNFIDTWSAPQSFLHGDAVRLTAPADWYRYDYWGHQYPVRGYAWNLAPAGFPAPGAPRLALLVRVTAGRMFVSGRGWFEANEGTAALGSQEDFPGACILYDATGGPSGQLQTLFNDDNLGDNGGWANVRVQQWF